MRMATLCIAPRLVSGQIWVAACEPARGSALFGLNKPLSLISIGRARPTVCAYHRLGVRAAWGEPVVFTPATVVSAGPAAEGLTSLFIQTALESGGYKNAGQYVQLRVGDSKPAFMAIASPPVSVGRSSDPLMLEILVKESEGTARLICDLKPGSTLLAGPVEGKGFPVSALPAQVKTLFLFATGSGISPIRALIESPGFPAGRTTKLLYGARRPETMAYAGRFAQWEAIGVRVHPVMSEPPPSGWPGYTGYIQDALNAAWPVGSPGSPASETVGAVLCGQKAMTESVIAALTARGVPRSHILLNF